jgi:hypothetical protein
VGKKDWALFLTTDVELSMSKMLETYALRWGIDIDQPLCLLKSLFALVEQLNDLPRPASWRIAQRA